MFSDNMPHSKETHEEMRHAVCGICWLKPKGIRNISAQVLEQIKTQEVGFQKLYVMCAGKTLE